MNTTLAQIWKIWAWRWTTYCSFCNAMWQLHLNASSSHTKTQRSITIVKENLWFFTQLLNLCLQGYSCLCLQLNHHNHQTTNVTPVKLRGNRTLSSPGNKQNTSKDLFFVGYCINIALSFTFRHCLWLQSICPICVSTIYDWRDEDQKATRKASFLSGKQNFSHVASTCERKTRKTSVAYTSSSSFLCFWYNLQKFVLHYYLLCLRVPSGNMKILNPSHTHTHSHPILNLVHHEEIDKKIHCTSETMKPKNFAHQTTASKSISHACMMENSIISHWKGGLTR